MNVEASVSVSISIGIASYEWEKEKIRRSRIVLLTFPAISLIERRRFVVKQFKEIAGKVELKLLHPEGKS
ncbi:hypothetical protein [Nostoc punctiforme]|uniref:hypothetical protein n=1 Tax=Nostoc punctiforme TaxID=272131 RepID=UPI000045BD63|nr:hypothetical protein [Nostoc punctiforme]